jgi:DMSO/TMAO reductase YedYZ heme-binding membrane subunit
MATASTRSEPTAKTRGSRRLSGRLAAVLIALVGLTIVAATDQVAPASSAHQAQLRVWLASRAAGIVTLVLLAVQIVIGLLMSHPRNRSTWKQSARWFAWHENLWLFVLAFVAAHVVAIVVDPYAGVGLAGALVPGLSTFRTPAVALGTIALDALLVTGITARWTKLLPAGAWLSIHRLALVVFVLAWAHGLLAGTDSVPLLALYVVLASVVGATAAYRYWIARAARPVHASLPEVPR